MDIIDWIILAIVLLGLATGYVSGLVAQISTLCGIVLGLVVCNIFGGWATSVLLQIIPEASSWPAPQYTPAIIANIVLFLIVFLGIKVVAAMIKSVLYSLKLGVIDRVVGSLFCAFKFLFIVSLALNVWYLFDAGNSMFTKRHALNNAPFEFTMGLAPGLLGVDCIPDLWDKGSN